MKATMIRKASNIEDWRESAKSRDIDAEAVNIIAAIELDDNEFKNFCADFLEYRIWLDECKEKTLHTGQGWQCLAVTNGNSDTAVLVACEGFGYARYTAAVNKAELPAK